MEKSGNLFLGGEKSVGLPIMVCNHVCTNVRLCIRSTPYFLRYVGDYK